MSLVADTIVGSTNGTTVTTGALDTTGATILVLIVSDANGAATVSDSKSNVWTHLTAYITAGVQGAVRVHYAVNPIVGTGHTFSAAGVVPAIAVQAHSGVVLTSPFEAESGAVTASGAPLVLGPLVPTLNDTLFITGYETISAARGQVDAPFTEIGYVILAGGLHYGMTHGYYQQTTAASQSARWTPAGAVSPESSAVLATFKTRSAVVPPTEVGMTLSQMLTILYDRLDYEDTPPTAVTRRLTAFINETQREVLRLKGMSVLRRRILPFTSIAAVPYCVLPQAMSAVIACVDRTTQRVLTPKDIAWIWQRDPGLLLTGPPDVFAVLDYMAPVAQDPPAAAALNVISTSASDTQNLYLEGVTSLGYRRQVGPIALTGTTAANLSASISDWISISRWYLDSAAVGFVSLRTSVPLELGVIPPGATFCRYTKLQLNPVPPLATGFYAYGFLEIYDLQNSTTASLFPSDFVHVLIQGALEKEYMKREKPAIAGYFRSNKERIIAELRSYLQSPQAEKGTDVRGFSALGPYYPAGS